MKELDKVIRNEWGISLVEVLMALGLLGIAAMGIASLMSNIMGSSKRSEVVAAKTQFVSALGTHLYSKKGCEELLGKTFTPAEQDFVLDSWVYQKFSNIQKNSDLGHFKVKELTARMNDTSALPTVKTTYADGSTKDLKKTHVSISLKVQVSEKTHRHVYKVPVLVDSLNKIEFCDDEQSSSEICTALNGTFDPVTKLCSLNEVCASYGSYVTLTCFPKLNGMDCDTSRGSAHLNPVTGSFGCPVGTVATATGADTWNTQFNCGKKCTAEINQTMGYFTCLKCP
jgi:type II secretory pathway pseudopilin PulG